MTISSNHICHISAPIVVRSVIKRFWQRFVCAYVLHRFFDENFESFFFLLCFSVA